MSFWLCTVITADDGWYTLFEYILGAGVSKWEVVVKVVDNLSAGMSKWEVAVKVANTSVLTKFKCILNFSLNVLTTFKVLMLFKRESIF